MQKQLMAIVAESKITNNNNKLLNLAFQKSFDECNIFCQIKVIKNYDECHLC